MAAHVGLVLDSLEELLGPGLPDLLLVGEGDEELHRLAALGITGVLVEGGDVIVVAVELCDFDSICFGADEEPDVVVMQVKDLALCGDT